MAAHPSIWLMVWMKASHTTKKERGIVLSLFHRYLADC